MNAEKKDLPPLLLFSLTASYRLHTVLLWAPRPLCSAEKCPTVPPRGAQEKHAAVQVSAGVQQFLCSSCWSEMKLSVEQLDNEFKQFPTQRARQKWQQGRLLGGEEGPHRFLSSYRCFHNPKCLCMKHKRTNNTNKDQHVHTNPPSVSHSRLRFLIQLP